MNILVTGSRGFVGKNLTSFLGAKYNLLTPSHKELELLDETAVREYFNKNQVDIVVHCANVGATRRTDNLPQIVGSNLRMFLNLAKQQEHFKKMIFFGSGAEFDKREDLVEIKENYVSANLPEGDYGLSKHLCSHFISESEKIINLRIFGVYGKHDDYENRFVSNAICRAVLGLPIVIFQNQVMSFIYIDDLVKIVEYFIASSPQEKFYNTASSQKYTLKDIAQKIKDLSGKDLEILVKQSGMAKEYTCNNSRLMKEMGHFEFSNLDDSLKEMYDWYEANKQLIEQSKFTQ